MGFPRQEYCNGLPFPTPRDLPNPGIKPTTPALEDGLFAAEPLGKPIYVNPKLTIYPYPLPPEKRFSVVGGGNWVWAGLKWTLPDIRWAPEECWEYTTLFTGSWRGLLSRQFIMPWMAIRADWSTSHLQQFRRSTSDAGVTLTWVISAAPFPPLFSMAVARTCLYQCHWIACLTSPNIMQDHEITFSFINESSR